MTFTYTYDFTVDRNRIRFEIGDVAEANALYQDEEIAAILTQTGSWQAAVIMCIDGVIVKLARTPSFTADWLKVDTSPLLRAYQQLRERKVDEYGLSSDGEIVSDAGNVYRADSQQTESPDYQEDA